MSFVASLRATRTLPNGHERKHVTERPASPFGFFDSFFQRFFFYLRLAQSIIIATRRRW
jgi:hypothetical protein